MLTISLDEQGKFEEEISKPVENQDPVFIGGFIYDDKEHPEDAEAEKKRIRLYLQAVCQEVGACYPKDLHHAGHKKTKDVKIKLSETISEFLKSGMCEFENNEFSRRLNDESICKPRQGKYHIVVYLKYGSENLLNDSASILVREGYASNLYTQMATETIERIVFHNPILGECEEICLDLPTRRMNVKKDQEQEYFELGQSMDEDKSTDSKTNFQVTNADIYRTALCHEMLNTGQDQITIKGFQVRSTNYGQQQNDIDLEGMSFLYMADIICSYLGYEPDKSSPEKLVEGFKKNADELLGHEDNLIFAYDKVDLLFIKAWKALEENDYYTALDLAYKGKLSDSPYAEYYTNTWFKLLRKRVSEEKDAGVFGTATRKYYLSTRSNDLRQDELLDLYEPLANMKDSVQFESEEDYESIYDLYDGAMTAFNHFGDFKRAEECFLQCNQYAKYVSTERYFRTRNKRVVFLMDSFQYEEALKYARKSVELQEELQTVRNSAMDDEETSKGYGIALSQLGQVYALIHDPKTETTFIKAMRQLEPGTSDYMQTFSYLLHYYISVGDKEKYDAGAKKYFEGESNLREQLTHIIHEGEKGDSAVFSMSYALYFYVKGLYTFHLEDIDRSEALLDCLCDIESTIKETGKGTAVSLIKDNPWEITYRYLALIALQKGRRKEADNYMEKIKSVLTYTNFTLESICLFGECEFAKESGEADSEKQLMKQLSTRFKENELKIYNEIDWDETENAYVYLKNNVMTFMYG